MADIRPGSDMPEDLQEYWTTGPGGAKIKWGREGDLVDCFRLLGEKLPARMVKGACARLHKRATGKWPAQGH